MIRMTIVVVLSFIAGVAALGALAQVAAGARDRAVVSNYINLQTQAATRSIATGDYLAGERHQRNALDAAVLGTEALALDSAKWGYWFPMASGVVLLFASDEASDARVRRQQEAALRSQLAETLQRQNRGEEAAAQRAKAAALK